MKSNGIVTAECDLCGVVEDEEFGPVPHPGTSVGAQYAIATGVCCHIGQFWVDCPDCGLEIYYAESKVTEPA